MYSVMSTSYEYKLNKRQISKIQIDGFKSIEKSTIELNMLNVLIGGNGAGKSNFISLFKLLDSMIKKELQTYISVNGGANDFLFFGNKQTDSLKIDFRFGYNGYGFELASTPDDHFVFSKEFFYWEVSGNHSLGSGHMESKWEYGTGTGIDSFVIPILKDQKWRVYHFHDTSDTASVKKTQYISNNLDLKSDAGNLAPFLYRLKNTSIVEYDTIVKTVKTVAPFFSDFVLEPNPLNPDNIILMWKDVRSEEVFKASQFSDGTLRFICLATLLLQPYDLMPETIVIDEPELGLHPFAIQMLAEMLRRVSLVKQVIITTQSVTLLNEFSPESIIVVNHNQNHTEFVRLNEKELVDWLKDDYSLGDLWEKNVLGGRPVW